MFGSRSKEELIIANAKLEQKCEILEKQISDLTGMVNNLSQALIAKESPRAYEDQHLDRNSIKDHRPVDTKHSQEENIIKQYLEEYVDGGNSFNDGDDLSQLLTFYETTLTDKPISDNKES